MKIITILIYINKMEFSNVLQNIEKKVKLKEMYSEIKQMFRNNNIFIYKIKTIHLHQYTKECTDDCFLYQDKVLPYSIYIKGGESLTKSEAFEIISKHFPIRDFELQYCYGQHLHRFIKYILYKKIGFEGLLEKDYYGFIQSHRTNDLIDSDSSEYDFVINENCDTDDVLCLENDTKDFKLKRFF